MSELRFDGKVVVITGAGAGLGRCHALFFAKRGAKVVVNDLGGSAHGQGASSSAADKVVAEIKAAGGTAVANYDSVEQGDKIIKTAIDSFGRIDVLINNAGILRDVSFQKMTKDDWDLIMRVHVNGAFACTHAAWPYMRDQGYGRIIFTTSAAGIYGNFGQANYSAAKLGLVGFSNTLAIEGEKKNVRANAIAPVAASRLTETVMPKDMLENLKPEYVTPLVAWLAHEECTENGGLFEVGAGFFGKLRWERTEGKMFKLGREITPEAVRGAWEQVTDFKKATHPANITDALGPVMANLSTKSKGGNEFIDVDAALGFEMEEVRSSYDERDLAIYALGVGAGKNPTDPADLHVVYERNGDGFYALPTFGVIPALNAFFKVVSEGKSAPGLNYGLDRILHGEQYTEVLRPLPPSAELVHKARISDIFDKGKNAVVVTHFDSYDAKTGELLVKNDLSMVVRGAGGWGGDRGPSSDVNVAPTRAPDVVVTEKTTESQALLYRLSGDWNPLHVDPEFATMFGFQKPILHGLCTFGFVGRAVINAFCKGDPRYFKSIKVRFADSVYPGETLKIELWKESDLKVLVRATVVEREKVCISNAAVELYAEIPKPKAKEAPKAATAAVAAPAKLDAATTFNAIGAYVAQTPDLVKSVGNVYQFVLKNPDSSWVVDLKNGAGAVKAGTVEKADCTLALSDADWLDMVNGKADPMKLFQGGKLKITGNVMASQKLDFLKKLDRSALAVSGGAAAAAAPSAAPAASGAITSAMTFQAIGAYLAKTPELAKSIGNVYQFNLKNPDSAWVLDLKNGGGSVKAGAAEKADCTLALSDADWLDMVSGKADPMKLFQGGKLKITGNVMASQKLDFLKKIDRKEFEAALASAPAAAAPQAASPTAHEHKAGTVIAALKERLAKNPALAKEVGATVAFKVLDGPAFTLDASGLRDVADAAAVTTITLSDEALVELAKTGAVTSLYQHGALRVDGSMKPVHRLGFFKQLV
ncbi:MAG: SDR family NAD(P)-dependent oxidoreductase [Myxococcaceae bacterium]|nr:SDR family NAD(P)-dependent oxidoreductase [Myxococcaceae bacterium]